MQAVEVWFPGDYWDSLVYNRRLYLFTLSGEVRAYDWERLVSLIEMPDDTRPVAEQFLTDSRAWYQPSMQKMLRSATMRAAAQTVVSRISEGALVASREALAESLLWTKSSPAHPHTDIEAFYSTIYIGSTAGLFATNLGKPSSRSPFTRVFDAPSFGVAGGSKTLGVASGSDGLFAQAILDDKFGPRDAEPKRISEQYCTACSWADFDLVGTSFSDGGVLAAYSDPKTNDETRRPHSLLDTVSTSEIFFRSNGFAFGSIDRLGLSSSTGVRYQTWRPHGRSGNASRFDFRESLAGLPSITNAKIDGDVLDASCSVFGTIIEGEEELLVLGSDGTAQTYGEPVNWRTFPRSHRYTNHMHITKESGLSVYAFIHDYFLPASRRVNATRRPVSSDTQLA